MNLNREQHYWYLRGLASLHFAGTLRMSEVLSLSGLPDAAREDMATTLKSRLTNDRLHSLCDRALAGHYSEEKAACPPQSATASPPADSPSGDATSPEDTLPRSSPSDWGTTNAEEK